MSEESFDKKLRHKIEGYQPPFETAAWQRFQKMLPMPWYMTRFFWLSVAGGAILLTSVGTNYILWKENRQLQEKKEMELSPRVVVQTDTVWVEKIRRDTVFLVKNSAVTPILQSSFSKKIKESTSSYPPESKEEKEKITNSFIPNSLTEQTEQVLRSVSDTLGYDSKEKHAEDQKETDKPQEKTEEPPSENLEPTRNPTTEKKFTLAEVDSRVGIGADYFGLKLPAIGPTFEVFLGKNLSFQTGILFSGQQTTRHGRPTDFNQRTGQDFETKYKRYFDDKPQRIEDISIATSFIKVPIFVQYYMQTPTNWAFLFQAGTKLDASVYQQVTFIDNALGQNQKRIFEAKPSATLFSSLTYGMGVHYQKGKFVAQLIPYFDFQFRSPMTQVIPRKFGVSGAIKMDLGKTTQRRADHW
ncbi:MAG: outer membrane beta-barrel protein [Spirosomataceae bacterium]